MSNNENIKYRAAVVFVKNIEISKKFYTEMLGQTIDLDFGKNVIMESGISLWEISPDHIIPEKLGRDSTVETASNRFEFYFETKNIDAVFQELKENGVELLHPLHEEPWGQRAVRFFDPDSHLVEIGETLETFIKRLHAENMTPEQVSEKTSTPLETVRELLDDSST